jgi:hypothetical protein
MVDRRHGVEIDRQGQMAREGWRTLGLLICSENDPRLSWVEREQIRQIGTKLNGERRDGVG